ncbi:MAG: hypothetical protein IKU61_00500 [Clostridia bacterium]|nr:hypothetical protein [Clostridia bacterium]
MSENTQDNLGGIASLLQNPEIASKLPRIMEAIAPVMAEMRAESGAPAEKENTEAQGDAEAAVASLIGGKNGGGQSKRYALLNALEPYLSESRREALNYILKVTSLIDVLSEVM